VTTLITGGSGLIGGEIATELAARGESVVCFDVDPPANPSGDAVAVAGDVTDEAALADAVATHDVDRLVHLAAMIGSSTNENPTKGLATNAGGTDNAFSVAESAGLDRVVYASTHSIYGNRDNYPDGPVAEDVAPPTAFSEYPEASFYAGLKQLNEYQSRLYADRGLDVRGVRPPFVFGPKRDRGWKGLLIDRALSGESHIPHPREAEICFTYVADVADLFVRLLLEDPSHHVYNTGGHTLTMGEIGSVVEDVTGGTVTYDEDGGRLSQPPNYSHERAKADVGYDLTPFEDCVRDYVERVT
jgi:nucleoside-diphosphate-sugar epimerase